MFCQKSFKACSSKKIGGKREGKLPSQRTASLQVVAIWPLDSPIPIDQRWAGSAANAIERTGRGTRPLRLSSTAYTVASILLHREGWEINAKRVYRIYREENLGLRIKTPRRRVSCRTRVDRPEAARINDCWAMDFMADELFDGRRIRLLTIVDHFTRESIAASALNASMKTGSCHCRMQRRR